MDDTTQAMLLIKTLDNDARLLLSDYTGQWYVSARIEMGDGVILEGGCKHRGTPQEAVAAYMGWLTNVPVDKYLVTHAYHDNRRHYRWNGAAFAEIPIGVSA